MRRSPLQLVSLCVTGALLAVAGILSASLLAPGKHRPGSILCLVCLVIGYLGMLWSVRTLRQGNRSALWPAPTLAPFQRLVSHRLWTSSLFLLFLGMLASVVFAGPHHRGWFWACFILIQAQTQLTSALVLPERASLATTLLGLRRVLPLHSSHWGRR